MRTVGRSSTRQIAALQERLTDCRVHTLANGFAGTPVDPGRAWEALAAGHARLTDNEDGTFTVRVHSNCWYQLRGNP
jgi:hypothetical protein